MLGHIPRPLSGKLVKLLLSIKWGQRVFQVYAMLKIRALKILFKIKKDPLKAGQKMKNFACLEL